MFKLFSSFFLFFILFTQAIYTQQLPAPTNLTVSQNPNTLGAYLQWEYSSAFGVLFKIYRAVDSDDSAAFNVKGAAQTTFFNDATVEAGHTYYYYVRATINGAMSPRSNIVAFTLNSPPPAVKGILSGIVINDANEPLANAVIRILRLSTIGGIYEAVTNELGQYAKAVDTGKYQLQAKREGYLSEWFDNKPSQNLADIVTVAESESVNCSFQLSPGNQHPPAPQNLAVGPHPSTLGAYLHWEYPANTAATFKIFRAIDTDDSTAFVHKGTSQTLYYYDSQVEQGHTYYYYVKAYNSIGVSPRSNIAFYTVLPPIPLQKGIIFGTVLNENNEPLVNAHLRFVRPNAGTANTEAVTNEFGFYRTKLDTGKYKIQVKKEGFVSEWFDNKPEQSQADIVFVANAESVMCNFQLAIVPPPLLGTVGGTVVDDSTIMPIVKASICFVPLNANQCLKEIKTDSSGMYVVELPVGMYKAKAMREGYVKEWFDNKYEWSEADTIVVGDFSGEPVTVNFALTRIVPPPMFHINGTVTDSVGIPLANAFVAVLKSMNTINRSHRYLGITALAHENTFIEGYGKLCGVVWKGFTDENGNYSATVRAERTYIVFAKKEGFYPEYFNDKHAAYDADKITLSNDTTGINFSLALNPNVQNSIAGKVKDSSGVGMMSHVALMKKKNGRMQAVRNVATDSSGNYSFKYVYTGKYFVRAFPQNGFAPAWYDANTCGTNEWQNADTVHAFGNVTAIDICVVAANGKGFAHISGTLRDNTNSIINGAVVVAISEETNTLLAFDVVEKNGSYSLENLLPGTYRIVVDCEGMTAETEPVITLSSQNGFHANNINVKLLPSTPLGVANTDEELPIKIALHQNYPNPFNPQTVIRYSLSVNSFVTLNVYDILGKEVAQLYNETLQTAGEYFVNFDASNLPSGMYYYQLTAGEFIETKKMILLR
jgi:hypothetical protein